MTTDPSPSLGNNTYPDSISAGDLSIAVIGPNEERRSAAVTALTECGGNYVRGFSAYPPELDDVPKMLERRYDVIIIELDSDPEYALELVESICDSQLALVMVYSEKSDPELLMRCMRAGAREFLTLPIGREVMAEALVRAAARRPTGKTEEIAKGRLLAFMGAKGGIGVTTLATNFAVALARESGEGTLLIDLDLPLGDAVLNLGIAPEFSTVDALEANNRLDAQFLSKLLVKHASGVSVLAAPGKFLQFEASNDAIDRLLNVARQEFANVVVDLGARLDWSGSVLLREASLIFLVTQTGIPELRNSNRLISEFFSGSRPKMEIVLNRYEPRALGIGEAHIAKALTRPAEWKVPNDYAVVRKMQAEGAPFALSNSPITRVLQEMARSVTGKVEVQKKKGFSLFG